MYSYFLQRNMTPAEVRRVFEASSIDSLEPSDNPLTKVVRIGTTRKYNLFTEKWEDVAKIEMQSAMDVSNHRFETCHEGHIRRITRHMLDKRMYMGMPYDNINQPIVQHVEDKYQQELIESGYPKDVVEQMLGWMFAKVPDISTMSFDIETEKHGDMAPNPMYAATPIISTAFKFHNVKGVFKPGLILMLSNELRCLDNSKSNQVLREMVSQGLIKMEIFHTEYELVMRTLEVLNDPDFPLCVTYYGEGFDLPYLYNRAVNLGINKNRIPFTAYLARGFKSTKGARTDWRCKFNDKMHIDLLQFFAQPVVMNYVFKGKYNRVGLENVSQAILGRGKIGHEEDINDMSLSTLAYYNFIDADLTLELIRKDDFLLLKVIFMFMRFGRQNYYEAAHRAIGNKVLNLFQGYMVEHDMLIPNKSDMELVGTAHSNPDIKGKGYRGAIVIPYVMGILRKVQSMDFGSLYPSMMKERNISFETVNCNHPECESNRVPELKHHICTKKIGIIPTLIGCMKDIRLKYFKPWSEDESLPEKQRNEYKAIEQGIKVFVNSSYGVFGTPSFGLACMPVAESITAWARDAITRVIIEAEKFGGNDLLAIAEEYDEEPLDAIERIPPELRVTKGGDSVPRNTPVMIKRHNMVEIIPIEDLFYARKYGAGKSRRTVNGVEIWTDSGWSQIVYAYRHKTKKRLFGILTDKGYVEVTEDHSLVINGKEVSPTELKIGDKIELYRSSLPNNIEVPEELAWTLGFYSAEGTMGTYRDKNNEIKRQWRLANKDELPLIRSQKALESIGFRTSIIRTSDGMKYLSATDNFERFIQYFAMCESRDGNKIVPSIILNGTIKTKQAFLDGYMVGDGHIQIGRDTLSLGSIDYSLIDGLCRILESLDYDYYLSRRTDKPNFIRVRTRKTKPIKRIPFEIISIEERDVYDDVFDIETCNHHFCGGVGGVLLHNTDSGHFAGLTNEQKQYLVEYSARVLKVILEAEREAEIMVSYLKKNYIMVTKSGKVTVKGMLGKKRNTPNIAVLCFEEYKELLKSVVSGDINDEELRNKTVLLVQKYYDKIWVVDGNIGDYTYEVKMTQDIDGYKVEPQHVKAARKWAKYVRENYTALSSASDSSIIPQDTFVRYVKKAESGIRLTKPGKKVTNIKCDPIPFQIATRDDVSPAYYHDSLLSVMDQVMKAMKIERSEVITSDPEQPELHEYFM